tara:strand:- start:1256 stop:1579 length:324 start_codon:yes stop_codon:yes gene_type:complete
MDHPIEISDEAYQKLIQKKEEERFDYIRLGVTGGGCAGFEYIFSTGDLQNDDIIIDFGPIKFLIDKISLPYIEGSTIIWVKDGLNEYFKYDNPKEKSSCGCGVSVQF